MPMPTLGFMYLADFMEVMKWRDMYECRMQTMINSEPMGNDPGYTHIWTVVLSAYDQERDEILALRILVTEAWSGFSISQQSGDGRSDADLEQAAEAVAEALADAGYVVSPGYYHHADIGYGAAPGLWHYQDGRLVLGATDLSEEEI